MSKEPKRNVYVGHRYVPKIMGEWDKAETYEGLSIVTNKGTSYTSKKRVPKGIDILDEEFWVVTGNYNAQIEEYRKNVKEISNNINKVTNEVNSIIEDVFNINKGIDIIENNLNNATDDIVKLDEKFLKENKKSKRMFLDLETDLNLNNNNDITEDLELILNDIEKSNVMLNIPKNEYILNKHIFDKNNKININDGQYTNYKVFSKQDNPYTKTDLEKNKLFTLEKIDELYPTLQGGYLLDQYLYLAFVQRRNENNTTENGNGIIAKVNIHTGEIVNQNVIEIWHANSISYNERDNKLYISYTDITGGRHKGAIVDPVSLEKTGEYSLGNIKYRHNNINIDNENELIICSSNHVEKKVWIFDLEFNLLHEFDMNTDLDYQLFQDGTIAKELIFIPTGASGERGENLITIYDYVGNKIDEYRILDTGDDIEKEETQFITINNDNDKIIMGYNDLKNKNFIFYESDLYKHSNKGKLMKTTFYSRGNIPAWETQFGKVSLLPHLDFIQNMGITAKVGNGIVDMQDPFDFNDMVYSGMFYYVGSEDVKNRPTESTSNGYILILSSVNNHCVQFVTYTTSNNYNIYMRKGISGNQWGKWTRLVGFEEMGG